MKFGVINTFNIIVTIILLFPNIIYSLKNRNKLNHISLFEIITFVGSILLFIFPIGINKFGFGSSEEMLIYLFYNITFLLIYVILWILYYNQRKTKQKFLLILIPFMIFLLNSIVLKHTYLLVFTIVFGISYIYFIFKKYKALS